MVLLSLKRILKIKTNLKKGVTTTFGRHQIDENQGAFLKVFPGKLSSKKWQIKKNEIVSKSTSIQNPPYQLISGST